MNINIEKTNDCQAQLTASVPAEGVKAVKKDIIKSYSRGANVPGFRPGKAPQSVIEKRYASAIEEEAEAKLREQVQDKCVADNKELSILEFGDLESSFGEDGSFSLSATLTVIPEFELPEYKGIAVSIPSTDVSEEEIDETLKGYAESLGEYKPVERAAEMGDNVQMDFSTSVEGKPTAEFCGKPVGFMEGREGHIIQLAEDRFMPGLAEGLVGLSAGDEKEIVLTMTEDFPIADLASKEVTFACKVTEVSAKEVPEVSVELFAEALPDKSMEEIRDIVRENLKNNKESSNDEAKIDQITEQIADQLSFSLPEALVEKELENTVQRKMYAAMQAGQYDILQKKDELAEESREETKRNLRVFFAIQLIAEREGITASDQEVYMQIAQLAERNGEKNLRSFMRKLAKENRIVGIRHSIVTSKVLDLLAKNATISIAEAEEAPAES